MPSPPTLRGSRPRAPAIRAPARRCVLALGVCLLTLGAAEQGSIRTLIQDGRYAEAESAARQRLAALESAGESESLEAAEAIDLIVAAAARGTRPRDPETIRLARRATSIKEKVLGPAHPELASSLRALGNLLMVAGDFAEAEGLYGRALTIQVAALGPEDAEVAATLVALGDLAVSKSELGAARPHYERALAIQERVFGPESLEVAQTLNGSAALLRILGAYPAALQQRERCLAIREKILGPEHPQVAWSLHNLANLLLDMGDLDRARTLYERALSIREQVLPPDHPDLGYSHSSLGLVLVELGDHSAASRHHEKALAIREKAFGPEHLQVAFSLNNLALSLRATGDVTAALALLRRSVAIKEKALGPDHPDVARGIENLGMSMMEMGDLDGARPLVERALRAQEKILGPDHPEVARSLSDLGWLHFLAGDAATGRPLSERALAIREKTLGPDHIEVARSLNDLALFHRQAGETREAMERTLRAERIGREHFLRTARTLAEREALGYQRTRESGLDLAISIEASDAGAGRDASWAGAVLDSLIRSRAMVLDEMAARRRVAGDRDAARFAADAETLARIRNRLARLAVAGPDPDDPARYRDDLAQALEEKEGAERRLSEKSAVFRRELARSRVGLPEVARSLPAGGVLVSFTYYHEIPWSAGPSPQRPSLPEARYLALLLRAGDPTPIVVPLGPAERIDTLVRAWKAEVSQGSGGPSVAGRRDEERYRTAGESLRRAVWDPLSGHLKGADVVFLVPDGSLCLVAFATLPNGRGQYLVETGPLIHLLSAERDIALPAPVEGDSLGLLVLGGPEFGPAEAAQGGRRPPCGDLADLRFAPLQGAVEEVEEIATLWASAGGARGPDDARVLKLIGRAAGESAFKQSAAGRRVLHLATHGFFLQDACTATGLKDNPFLLSGLALAGANRRADPRAGRGIEDGILTAEEIASLDLSGVDWVVLSACETGSGRVQAGEGVLGLRRAFETAGAATLIMSLWSVPDAAAREWMRALYKERLGGRSTAEAVRGASLQVLKKRRRAGKNTHPHDWGAFVASGDWR